MDDSLLDSVGPIVVVLVAVYVFARRIRFLWQGRCYRRLDAQTQMELTRDDPEWYEDHGRPMPRSQLMTGIVVAAAVLGWLVWSR